MTCHNLEQNCPHDRSYGQIYFIFGTLCGQDWVNRAISLNKGFIGCQISNKNRLLTQPLRRRRDLRRDRLHGQEQGLAVAGPEATAALLQQPLARRDVARRRR